MWFRVCSYCGLATLRHKVGKWLLPHRCPRCGRLYQGF